MELLTVIAIIALIGGLSAGTYQAARRNYALVASAGRIQAVLRAARNTSLSTGIPSTVVIDPVSRTATASAFERVAEWSFDEAGDAASTWRAFGTTSVPGAVGRALRFGSAGAYVDCGAEGRFDLRTSIQIEAWVRNQLVPDVKAPVVGPRARRLRGAGRKGVEDEEPAATIVEKEGSYSLGMAADGALEGGIGGYFVRTAGGVVSPGRWVRVALRFDGRAIELSADGIPRKAEPREPVTVRGKDEPSGPPPAAPVTPAPLRISSPEAPFPGDIDEVTLSGGAEDIAYRWADHEHVIGWKKVIRFDRHGHLDPAFHGEGVRIVLLDLDEKEEASASRTAVVVDYGKTFEEWLATWEDPPLLRESVEEAKLEAKYEGSRKAVVEVDRLGVVR